MISNYGFSQVLEIKGNNTIILNSDTTPSLNDFTDFGSVPSGNKFARSFILKNTGTSTLTFPSTATSVKITGTNAVDFSITTSVIINPLSLTANTYTIIDISFNPTSTGLKTATLTIDPSNGSPATYSFTIQGTGTTAATSDFVMTKLTPNNTFNYPYVLLYGPDNYLWTTERVGKKINRVNPSTGVLDQLIDMSSLVYQTGGQDGLMSMVFDPNFATNNYVYVAYTYSNTGSATDDATRRTKIVRYTYSVTSNDGLMSSPTTIIQGLSGSNDHNSGKLKIGPDNKLYYTIGDNGANQFANWCKEIQSQTLPTQADVDTANYYTSYQGKILRMNLDGTIPADNPNLSGVKSHIYSYGHRNPQGLVFGKNGKLYSSEHGPKSDDEINIIKSGENYGWPFIAGYKDNKNYAYCNWSTSTLSPRCQSSLFTDYTCGTGATSTTEMSWAGTFTPPIATFFTIDDGYNFTGGYLSWPTMAPSSAAIYENFNSEIPGWNNSLLITTLKKGELCRQKLSPDGNTALGAAEAILYTQNRYRDVAMDPDGKTLYIITDSGGQTSGPSGSQALTVSDPGVILKFVYQPVLATCAAPTPDVTTLPTINSQCSASLTAPTATNACAGTAGIVGLTDTVFPIITLGTTTVVWTYKYGNELSVTQNQTVIITPTTWNGSTWNNGAPSSATAAIIAGDYNVAANIDACSLAVNNNAIVSIPSGYNVTLNGALTVSSGSFTLNTNANLIQTTNVSNSGNIIVKRDSSPLLRLDYTLWSSPVTSQKLSDFSPLTTTTRFYAYSTATNVYSAVLDPSTTNFNDGQGYLIRMPNTHPVTPTIWNGSFMGVPHNGNYPIAMTNSGIGKRFNLVGNPYPSPVNMSQFVTDNTTAITGTLYFWRKTNNPLNPSYCTWAGGTFVSNGQAQVVNPNGIIQTGQGFFVEALNTSTSIQFNNGQRVANTTGQFFKTRQSGDRSTIWLNATNTLGAFSQMAVTYLADASAGVDSYDGKYFNDGEIALSSMIDNVDYAIQGRALPFDATDMVPLGFRVTTTGDYSIAVDHFDGLFSGSQDIILKDNVTGTETDLKTNSYSFTAVAGTDTTRFLLKYQKTLGVHAPLFNENNVSVFKNKGTIYIKSQVSNIDSIQLYDIKGSLLFEKMNINSNATYIESSKFINQVLIVKIASSDKKVVSKKIVN